MSTTPSATSEQQPTLEDQIYTCIQETNVFIIAIEAANKVNRVLPEEDIAAAIATSRKAYELRPAFLQNLPAGSPDHTQQFFKEALDTIAPIDALAVQKSVEHLSFTFRTLIEVLTIQYIVSDIKTESKMEEAIRQAIAKYVNSALSAYVHLPQPKPEGPDYQSFEDVMRQMREALEERGYEKLLAICQNLRDAKVAFQKQCQEETKVTGAPAVKAPWMFSRGATISEEELTPFPKLPREAGTEEGIGDVKISPAVVTIQRCLKVDTDFQLTVEAAITVGRIVSDDGMKAMMDATRDAHHARSMLLKEGMTNPDVLEFYTGLLDIIAPTDPKIINEANRKIVSVCQEITRLCAMKGIVAKITEDADCAKAIRMSIAKGLNGVIRWYVRLHYPHHDNVYHGFFMRLISQLRPVLEAADDEPLKQFCKMMGAELELLRQEKQGAGAEPKQVKPQDASPTPQETPVSQPAPRLSPKERSEKKKAKKQRRKEKKRRRQ